MPKKPTTKKPAVKKTKTTAAPASPEVTNETAPVSKPAKACTCRLPGCL